jgi:hypothetical protein
MATFSLIGPARFRSKQPVLGAAGLLHALHNRKKGLNSRQQIGISIAPSMPKKESLLFFHS